MASRAPAPPPRKPLKPITTVGPQQKTGLAQTSDWVISSVDYDLGTAATKHGLSLVGGGNLTGIGNSGGTSKQNTLTAASNTGNTSLYSGTASTTMIGGSGDNWIDATPSQGTVSLKGGSGSSTMYAANGPSTLVGGGKNNYLVAGTSTTRTLGQSLVGGASSSSLYGNTLFGGTGRDTLRSGAGYSTLISGSNAGASTTISSAAASGASTIRVASVSGLAVGQQLSGNGIAAGTTIIAISGTQLTLSAKTTAAITSGTRVNNVGNILIGQGTSNSLTANAGNDSLVALSGNSTLLGGTGQTSLFGAAAGTNNWLQSGSTGAGGNSLVGGAGSNTLVAGSGRDSIVGGINQNLLVVNQANLGSLGNDTISLSTLVSSQNTLGVSLNGASLADSHLSGIFSQTARNLGTVQNLSSTGTRIELGSNAQTIGVSTLASGIGGDTLSVAAIKNPVYLDASRASSRASLVGSTVTGAAGDTFLGSNGGFDTMKGSTGSDLFILQNPLGTSNVIGNSGTDTLRMNRNASFDFRTFNSVSGVEVLSLAGGVASLSGVNSVGSLQGSGITTIIGGQGVDSDVISASCAATVQSVTAAGSFTLKLALSSGASGTMGFSAGQFVTGNGIQSGTMIVNNGASALTTSAAIGTNKLTISNLPSSYQLGQAIFGNGVNLGTISAINRATSTITLSANLNAALDIGATISNNTLTLSKPTSSAVAQGTLINGWFNNFVIDGSGSTGQLPKASATADVLAALFSYSNASNGIYDKNKGLPNELGLDVQTFLGLQNDPLTYIQRQGDSLVTGGFGSLVKGAISTSPDALIGGGNLLFTDSYGNKQTGIKFYSHVVTDNTIVSGMFNTGSGGPRDFASNTLVGGPGQNLYILNNLPGDTLLPFIQNNSTIQSGSTFQFTSNGVQLNDSSFAQVGSKTAQIIRTADGNNLIQIGAIASPIGIRSIIGGIGSDTFTTPSDYLPSVYLDASRNGGNSSLVSGSGNDTLLGGSASSTLLGGDGNNSLIGGNGYNLIKSGVGNSTLDSGYGISTLQADGGTNTFVVRNRWTRILNSDPANPQTGTIPEVGIVDTYVNFDPILGSPVSQFDPGVPDNSPSITKSPSFASSDLSSFYNLKYFNLLGVANYGVGNALDNTITAAAANALILGMGGNNTIVASGAGSTLYGDSYANYASPDLYAYAPIDTRDQAFVDGVMGVAGNNSLVASGGGSILDGGAGYDDGLFDGSGANTLVASGANNTVIVSHQNDMISLTGASNTVITSVDLYQTPDNASEIILNVTPQFANSGQVTFEGQRMTAGYAAISNAKGAYTDTNSLTGGFAPEIVVNNSVKLHVNYGISDGTVYGTPDTTGADLPLTVGEVVPDPKNPGKEAVTLSWTTPLTPEGDPVGHTFGYLVNYQIVASHSLILTSDAFTGDDIISVADVTGINIGEKLAGSGIPDGTTILAIDSATNQLTLSHGLSGDLIANDILTASASTPYLTYLKGTSQDLNGTSVNPRLLVDNLSTSFTDPYTGITYDSSNSTISYNFKVTAQETVLPAYTDANGNLIARPVTLIGGQGNDVIYGGLLQVDGAKIELTRPVLTNNPINSLIDNDPGLITTPAPWNPPSASQPRDHYPTYISGGLSGNDLLISARINDGSGNDFTAYEYINGEPRSVSFGGFNTLEGGQGSDTFVVMNGGTTIDTSNGVVTTGAYDHVIKYGKENENNLIDSFIPYLTLSDTVVDQGKFINQAWAAEGGQYIGGNRLDNTLVAYGAGSTLLGAGGRDYLDGKAATSPNTLIGGTAYGLDSIAGALVDYAAGQTNSIYRDTDPTPVNVNGPGTADNSQYWMVNGTFDPLRNSDTLVASGNGDLLDGGAGNDSMFGGVKNDTFYVSSPYVDDHNAFIGAGDVLVGGGGNDWVVFTGSDYYWSGLPGATTAQLGYTLSNKGDAVGGQSISNLILQAGDPIARNGTGNSTSTGQQHNSNLGTELGSNMIIGNSGNNILNGGGVGGGDGKGVGVDTLIGNGGADTFVVAGYTASSVNTLASGTVSYVNISGSTETDTLTSTNSATDGDWVRIDVSGHASDAYKIQLGAGIFLLGAAPSSFGKGNLNGGAWDKNDFGIYKYTPGGHSAPNLVAEVLGANLDQPINAYTVNVEGAGTLIVDGGTEVNHLGGSREIIQHAYSQLNGLGNSDWYTPATYAATAFAINPATGLPIPGSQYVTTAATYGGDISSSALVNQANTDVHNFLGMGAMYNLQGSGFDSHVI